MTPIDITHPPHPVLLDTHTNHNNPPVVPTNPGDTSNITPRTPSNILQYTWLIIPFSLLLLEYPHPDDPQ